MSHRRSIAPAALLIALLAGSSEVRAQSPTLPARLRIEARFVDRASGLEAGWGATGQILIPPASDDPSLQRWREARTVAISPSRQSLTLEPGARGLIRVGREIPFVGWFLRHGQRCGWMGEGVQWREVESALEIELEARPPAPDGTVRFAVTPEFSFIEGRTRRTVAFPGERAEIAVPLGGEARLEPGAAREPVYGRLLSGYDPLRRVWPVDLVLRVDPADPPEP